MKPKPRGSYRMEGLLGEEQNCSWREKDRSELSRHVDASEGDQRDEGNKTERGKEQGPVELK